MSTQRNAVSIKGAKSGLQIVLDDKVDFEEVVSQLRARLEATDAFFQGSRVAVDVGDRVVTREQWSTLEAMLRQKNLVLTAALAVQEDSRSMARSLGIPLVTESKRDLPAAERRRLPLDVEGGQEGLFIRRTLRSGQVIRYPGSVFIMGDVNAGAEIIAEGDITVWGSLRGVVHAGSSGDESALVCALHLGPTQLRLAGHIARSPSSRVSVLATPEIASVKDGRIVVDEWLSQKRPANPGLRTIFFLVAVFALEAVAVAAALRYLPAGPYAIYVVLIVMAAIVLGSLAALWMVKRQDHT
jgi:septum site-determining protein MinC